MNSPRSAREIKLFEQMIGVAKMYYLENLSQQQIADRLGMSRSNVSRIIASCKEEGIVEIRIHEAALRTNELKRRLMDRYELTDVILLPRRAEQGNLPDDVGRLAAEYMDNRLDDNLTVGLGWGATIYRMVSCLKSSSYHQLHAVQLIGGTNINETYKDGVQLVLDFARRTGGAPHILNAPLLVSSKQVRDLFIEENSIKRHLELTEKIDVAAVTVGTNDPARSTMVSAGYLTRAQAQMLCDQGLHTHILGQHIDDGGSPGQTELNDRVVGIGLEDFKQIPLRIGVACGAYKTRQIAAALRGGYINILVTDELTALEVERCAPAGDR